MDKLITKQQYINFEPGEFTDEKWRTKEEVISLIDAFPWEKQREHILIDYTNPGIVLQTDSDYLKLALYYNGKFVLYFFDGTHLYSKSLMGYKDAYPFITDYFNKGAIDTSILKKENLLFKHVSVHFISKDFKYFVNNKRVKDFLIHTSFFNLIMFLLILVSGVVDAIESHSAVTFCTVITPLLVFSVAINLRLFFNYFVFMKNKMLVLSKGNEHFWYGGIDNIKQYDKKAVQSVVIISSEAKNDTKKGLWSEFALYKIYFSDDTRPVIFTSLLINKDDFKTKFSRTLQTEERTVFPFISEFDITE